MKMKMKMKMPIIILIFMLEFTWIIIWIFVIIRIICSILSVVVDIFCSPMKQDQEQEEEQAFRGWTSEEQERGEKEKERLDHTFLLSMGLEEQEAGRRAVSLGQVRGAGRLGGRLWVLGVGGVGVRLVVWLALVTVTLGQVRGAGG